ncbi:MAG: SDR family oxidoreductase [Bacteroidetes bacterium]|nr:SDR family oxidoreductase [Bacteroidota bacterium]
MNLSLENKRAFVCGSTQGIGKAAAMELAQAGATITLLARNEAELVKTCRELPVPFDQQHDFICADFAAPDHLKSTVEKYLATKNPVHILINNTGGPAGGLISEAKTDDFFFTFSQHLACNHILAQAVLGGMKKSGYGRIINIISTSVKQPIPGLGVSNTIRAAVASWSKTLAGEVAAYGITVNNILPGATETIRLKSLLESKSQRLGKPVDVLKNEMLSEIPMKRFADAGEIANAVAFLASPAASYITGINLPVDGGRTLCL